MARILDFDSTICAIATGNGGAIGVIRMSGKGSFTICERVFHPINKSVKLLEQPGYSIVFGSIVDGEEVIDEVLVSLFRAPHSYTGEDSVEISCHASKYIERRIMEVLIGNGATMARPGEFTQRAFMNGKLDLSQAEAVADVIASESKLSHKIAMNQMRGAFSEEIKELRAQLLHFASLIELELDFNEEDVQFADREELMALAQKTLAMIRKLIASFSLGNAIKHGVPVAIVGNPNTGKSTLLNLLLGDDKALVSDIPGTTRDSIEDVAVINGVEFRFIDTAGIRETTDIVENMGINRTREKIDKASVIIVVCDINADVEST
ncbi:MAG: tRNA uridine-5-carboxymethylaminomethyl(34) synthesis GTPase MnmE, partial [Bacteroidales bacterium]|nr:tRNA uridine-5-carboxymethylaminomethyl(34) synthesis GTPase MnmE [Bacteroidales bacterium]